MKNFKLILTELEIDLILKMLDKASTVGIETQRTVVGLADKLTGIVRSAAVSASSPEAEKPADSEPAPKN
jgi:hypothetical protein